MVQQSRFMGASINAVSTSLGWNEQGGNLNVTLVEDTINGDVFFPPTPGTPVMFQELGLRYGGIFTNYVQDYSTSGKIYRVNIDDAKSILEGVVLVIGAYNGIAGVPNLFNIFGYWENEHGFGSSNINDSGMPIGKIVQGVNALINNPTIYGGPINFSGFIYQMNLSEMPVPPADYRIQGPSITLLDFISQVCHDMGNDWFVRLEFRNNQWFIKIETVSRVENPQLGKIASFVGNSVGAVATNIGLEWRNETTSKLLVGDNKLDIAEIKSNVFEDDWQEGIFTWPDKGVQPSPIVFYHHHHSATKGAPECAPPGDELVTVEGADIWPYWGVDLYNTKYIQGRHQSARELIELIDEGIKTNTLNTLLRAGVQTGTARGVVEVGMGISAVTAIAMTSDNHYFMSSVPGYPYIVTIGEARACLESQDVWENFISARCEMLRLAEKKVKENINEAYKVGHTYRDILMNLSPTFVFSDPDILKHILELGKGKQPPQSVILAMQRAASQAAQDKFSVQRQKNREAYEGLNSFCQENYGRKWLVKVPDIQVKLNDQNQPITNKVPEPDGYFDGDTLLGLNRLEQEFFKTPEGKIQAFAVFDSVDLIDIPQLSPDDFIITATNYSQTYHNREEIMEVWSRAGFGADARLYLKCGVEPNFVFKQYDLQLKSTGAEEDKLEYEDPRAVVVLPYVVPFRNNAIFSTKFDKTLDEFFVRFNEGIALHNLIANVLGRVLDKTEEGNLGTCVNLPGAKFLGENRAPAFLSPVSVAVPLRDTTQSYGPWYVKGAFGKTEFEKDESLNPWNYNGETNMNNAALARVQGVLSNMQYSETGTIEIPGTPNVQLGDALSAGGPIISDMNISVGEQGIKTTYNMRTFTPGFGDLSRTNLQRIRKATEKKPIRHDKVISGIFKGKVLARPVAGWSTKKHDVRVGTPHELLMSYTTQYPSGQYTTTVISETMIEARPEIQESDNLAGISMEGLFTPFCTKPSGNEILPCFPVIDADVTGITYKDLNPFLTGTDYSLMGGFLPSELPADSATISAATEESGAPIIANVLGLRTPLMLVGWGHDTEGNIVPDTPDYYANRNKWIAAPLDVRYDATRGVWAAGGGASLVRATMMVGTQPNVHGIEPSSVPQATAQLSTGEMVNVESWCNIPTCSGQRVFLNKETSGYYLVQPEFGAINVISDLLCESGNNTICSRTLFIPAATTEPSCNTVE